ncbi:MAG: DUF4215 domain-containing protein [Parcubacteria group bacterium]
MQKTKTKTAVAVALVALAIILPVAYVVVTNTSGSSIRKILSGGGRGGVSVSSKSNEGSVTNQIKPKDSTTPATPPPAASVCGNNSKESGEECDDGNTKSGDGCSGCTTVCTQDLSAEFNGTGNIFLSTAQAAACTSVGECGGSDGFTCKNGQCQKAVCGDGFCNDCSEAFSPCAPTETNINCSRDCRAASPTCGNGKLEANEKCDDGNTQSNDGCSATCKKETCRTDCSRGCKKEAAVTLSGRDLTNLSQPYTEVLSIGAHESQLFRLKVEHKFLGISSPTKDWGTVVNMLVMYAGPTGALPPPNKNDYDLIIDSSNKGAYYGGSSPKEGGLVNGRQFWFSSLRHQNQSIYITENAPQGYYYVYMYNTSDITGKYLLTWTQR